VDPAGAGLYPELEEVGDDLVQVVPSEGGDEQEFRIYGAYLAAIRNARVRVWISQAYFAPDAEFRDALSAAEARGVDVRVIVPAFTIGHVQIGHQPRKLPGARRCTQSLRLALAFPV
jgi:phosphatidylserine/phosphatidylglycerophosphate/cardiolipin synthase-like enzyme